MNKKALLVIDMQVDFCENGVLAAQDTLSLFAELNSQIKSFETDNILTIFTKDYHTINHSSFVQNGGIWPVHCVEHTYGSNFHQQLYLPSAFITVHKGINISTQGYSAFENTKLQQLLKNYNIQEVLITGIAAEYCVMQSAIDANKLGFKTTVLKKLTRGINNNPVNLEKIWSSLNQQGIKTQ